MDEVIWVIATERQTAEHFYLKFRRKFLRYPREALKKLLSYLRLLLV